MQACALKKPFECADKVSGAKTPELYRSMIHQDSKGRDDESLYSNYTFTTLIDRFTSLHGVPRNFMVVKEPTYKI